MPGRGRRHELAWRGGTLTLIDESYNASPAAMRAALAVLAATEPAAGARRVAVLGDMLELGDASERLHRELAEPLAAAEVDRVFLVGEAMAALHEALPEGKRGGLWRSAEEAIACAAPLSRTRRCRDDQRLPRRARQPHRGAAVRAESARPET